MSQHLCPADVDEGAYVVDEEEVQAELERQEREEQAAAEAEGGDEADGQSSRQAQLAAQPQDFGRWVMVCALC